ncbi:MAG: F0F1 ATP synthase subunit B [Intestinibacter sp.]|uniref:F0F1 ATP synthase subunit B n=1 Tax=Intestinibacter sp. TaxID=1965304 RepID=UPI0025B9F8CD|nr:F0F1 ATP synthase subunit B [Intestinibacter sp.]MCI6737260.1 F0F1 ATP synthase subunit B [Intestinibacter sp.]
MDFKPVVIISWELLFQIINTVILFLVLKKILFKPVLNIIEKRENMIQEDLAAGAKAKNEGIALKKEYEEKVSIAKEEGREIIRQATARAEEKSNQIVSDAQAEAVALKAKASKDIAQEKEQAIAEIRNDISDIAILAASKVLEEDIDKSKHEDLIEKFIKEVGEAK